VDSNRVYYISRQGSKGNTCTLNLMSYNYWEQYLVQNRGKLLHWRAKLSGLDSSGTSSKLRNKVTFIFKQLFLE